MQLNRKPIAFVDESGYIVPNPTFSSESIKHLKGCFLYTPEELKQAMDDMNRRQNERRVLADKYYGGEAVEVPASYETIEAVIENMDGVRETVPSMTASPNRKRQTQGKSEKLRAPNMAELPDSLHKEQFGVGLTKEERDNVHGIDAGSVVDAMFGKKQ